MLIIYPTVCILGGSSGVVGQVPTLVVGVHREVFGCSWRGNVKAVFGKGAQKKLHKRGQHGGDGDP